MQVNFYTFAKKENSTAQPGGTLLASLDCALKDPCTVINPQIRCAWPSNNMLPDYAYISAFGRYYFITNIQYAGSAIIFSMAVDVLATYKSEIGGSTQYVVRSASDQNPYIQDSYYTTLVEPKIETDIYSTTPFYADGSYIIGVVGDGSGTVGTAKGSVYYCMNASQMADFCKYANMNSTASAIATDFINDVGATLDSFAGQLLHVFDYVKTAFWVPLPYNMIAAHNPDQTLVSGPVKLGAYTIPSVTAYKVGSFNVLLSGSDQICAFYLPGHPQESDVGQWINSAPYQQHYIDIPFVGTIPVESDSLTAGDAIIVEGDVSMIDGSAEIYLIGEKQDGGPNFIIARYNVQLGVPIPINVVRNDMAGVAGGVIGGVASALTGNFLGAAAGIASAVGSAIPTPRTIGGAAGYHVSRLYASIITKQWYIADQDPDNHGSPLCSRVQLNTLSGYLQTQGAALDLAATDTERAQVISLLDSGIFYE